MIKHTTIEKNEMLLRYLMVLRQCYSTGMFEPLFDLLSDDIVFESQWVLTPNKGRKAVEDYFIGKGKTLISHNCCPDCYIVQLIGNINKIENAGVSINDTVTNTTSRGLFYPNDKLCMYMSQKLNDSTNGVIVDLTLDDNDKICRIDLCMPELFNFKIYKGE